jgi:hypothetical protein
MKKEDIYFGDVLAQLDVLMATVESEGQDSEVTGMALECFTYKMLDYMTQERRAAKAREKELLEVFDERNENILIALTA